MDAYDHLRSLSTVKAEIAFMNSAATWENLWVLNKSEQNYKNFLSSKHWLYFNFHLYKYVCMYVEKNLWGQLNVSTFNVRPSFSSSQSNIFNHYYLLSLQKLVNLKIVTFIAAKTKSTLKNSYQWALTPMFMIESQNYFHHPMLALVTIWAEHISLKRVSIITKSFITIQL